MFIQAIYIEDTPAHADDFKREAAHVPNLRLVKVFANYDEAAAWFGDDRHIDMIFCDIELPGPNGLRIAKALQDRCHFFVFVSGHTSYREAAWEVSAKGYLMKPVLQDELREVVEQLRRIKRSGGTWHGDEPYFFYRDIINGGLTRIVVTDVTEITKGAENKNHTKILRNGEPVFVNKSLSSILEDLAPYDLFIRLREDVAVAKSQIKSLKNGVVSLQNGNNHVVTDGNIDAVNSWIKNNRP